MTAAPSSPASELDLAAAGVVANGLVILASAGTGKTYSVAALVTRALAEDDSLRIANILITTYTRNAAAELKDRIRRRLADTALALGQPAAAREPHDVVLASLAACAADERAWRIERLERACTEFDAATIGTIHSICHRVLTAAGQETADPGDDDLASRIVAEVVNDFVVEESAAGRDHDETAVAALVHALLGDPHIEPWFDAEEYPDAAQRDRLEHLQAGLVRCARRVQDLMRATPSFNDLLRRARDVVVDPTRAPLVAELRRRYRLAIVDEAQDTDALQWEFFRGLFPAGDRGDGRALVAVGDPKQSIYGFRGADVRAFVRYAASCGAAGRRTLSVNRRSDQPLLAGLNAAFAGAEFGAGIGYLEVHAPESRQATRLVAGAPIEFVDLGNTTNQDQLAVIAARKVIDALDAVRLGPEDRGPRPGEVCVLVRAAAVGLKVQQELARHGIRSVTAGTSSVMESPMAEDIRTLLEALDRPSNQGRIRRVAATAFFGRSLRDTGTLDDDALLSVQEKVGTLAQALRRSGLAALGAMLSGDATVMARITGGDAGERNVTDFAHVIEIMHARGVRGGITPAEALELFAELARAAATTDTVSRRVESDADAVSIMTIHKAKGLEFPCVIVADLWKHTDRAKAGRTPAVFEEGGRRLLDVGYAELGNSARAIARVREAQDEEARRLLYVAATRAEHHLSILVARPRTPSLLQQLLTLPDRQRPAAELPTTKRPEPAAAAPTLAVAAAPTVVRTYQRVSYTGLVALRSSRGADPFAPEGGGFDEEPAEPRGETGGFRIPELPGGTAAGRVIHEIFEQVDPTRRPLDAEVRRVVQDKAASGLLAPHHEGLVRIVTESLETPWGGGFGDVSFAMIPPADRLAEAGFEMSLVSLAAGLQADRIGAVLGRALADRPDDPLAAYARLLAAPTFAIPVGGLLNGSIDAIVRLPGSTPTAPRLAICDYKSNMLHAPGAANPLDAYDQAGLLAEMVSHHYPLQALLYGTAVFRWLRWRAPAADPDACIAGIVYAFIRGMKGPATPVDAHGRRHGVFTWRAPPGLWAALSDLLAGRETAA
jgi:exodeoxyribonuclease V beta subunit